MRRNVHEQWNEKHKGNAQWDLVYKAIQDNDRRLRAEHSRLEKVRKELAEIDSHANALYSQRMARARRGDQDIIRKKTHSVATSSPLGR